MHSFTYCSYAPRHKFLVSHYDADARPLPAVRKRRQRVPCNAALKHIALKCNIRLFQRKVHAYKLAVATSAEVHYPPQSQGRRMPPSLTTCQMTTVLRQALLPIVKVQVTEALRMGLSRSRIYLYYSYVLMDLEKTWDRKWRHNWSFWDSPALLFVAAYLVDFDDPEAMGEDGYVKPTLIIKALAMALEEL